MNSSEKTVRDIHAFVDGSDLDPHCMEEAIGILDEALKKQRNACGIEVIAKFMKNQPKVLQDALMATCRNARADSDSD